MKSKRLLLMLLMALLVPWAAQAQETLTVYDETTGTLTTNAYVPMYGNYFDAYTKSEFVIPADQLSNMDGGTITSLKFYIQSVGTYGSGWSSNQQVFLKEVSSTSLSAFSGTDDATIVWEGSFTVPSSSDTEFEITFTTPYEYQGGNLLVGIYNITKGGYRNVAWYGQTVNGASGNGQSSSSLSGVSFSQKNFIPKTTFTYEPAQSGGDVCEKPATLVAEDVTGNSATLTWTGGSGTYNVEVKGGAYSDWTEVLSNTNLTTTQLTLQATTSYQARVQSVCDGTTPTSGWKSVSFTTPCDSYDIPYTYGFEDAAPFACWTVISGNITRYNGTPNTGSYRLDFRGTTSNMIALPQFNEATNNLRVEFWTRPESTGGSSGKFAIGYMTDITDAGTFVAVETYNSTEMTTTYVKKTVDFVNVPANANIAMRQFDCSTNYYWYVDDVTVKEIPSCVAPTALDADASTTSAELSWTANSNETAWTLYWKESSATDYIEVANATNPYTLSGLTAATNYEYYVVANCSTDDASEPSEVFTFATDCEAVTTFPWSEDFESYASGDFSHPCWVNEHISGNGTQIFKVYTSTNGSNSTHQLQLPDMTSGTLTKLMLPEMTLPGDNYLFSIDVFRNTSTANYGEGIRVFVSTDGEIEGATELAFISRSYTTSDGNLIPAESASGWYTYELPIPMSGTCYIILRGESQYGSATYMDNFAVMQAPSCVKPTGLAVSNITGHEATITWTSAAEAWQICVNDDEENLIDVTENTYTLTGLAPETTYAVKVRANCGDDGYSDWTDNVSFTTDVACPAPTNLAVTPESITAREATVTWEGTSNSYVVMIGQEEIQTVTTDFEDQRIPTSFTNDASRPWTVTAGGANESGYCAIPGNAGVDSSSSDLTIQVTGPGTVSFNAKVSSEGNYDFGRFLIDGTQKMQISGTQDWTAYSYELTEGTHTLIWRYYKDSSTASGDDLFYVDDIVCPISTVPSWTEYTTDAQTYTFENLTPNTPYKVKVKGNCGDEGYSQETAPIIFTTLESCVTPTDLAVSNITAHEATITWTSAAEAWQICVNDDEENLIDVREATYTFSGLAPETDYTVKVRTNCGNEYSDWTNNVSFTTGIACPAPTNLVVTDGSITARSATVTWEGTSNSYVVMIGEENLAVRADFEDQTIPAEFTNSTSYPWTVTAGGANGSGYCAIPGNKGVHSSDSDLTLEVTLNNPATVSFYAMVSSENNYDWGRFFIDGTQKMQISGTTQTNWTAYSYELTEGTHTLIWKYDKDGSSYSGDDLFYVDDIVISAGVDSWTEYTTNAQTYTFENLTPNTSYQAKVKGNCGDEGYSQETAPVSFTTDIACHVPTNLTVIESTITTESAELTWEPGTDSPSQDTWQIAISDEEGFDPDELIDLITVRESPTYVLNNLTQNTTYYIYVRALCGTEDYSDWSAMSSFTTLPACQAPENLRVDYLSQTSATVRWSGNADNYILTLGQAALGVTFEDNNILALFNNNSSYPWTIAEMNGSYCMRSGNAGVHNSASSISISVYYDVDGTLEFDAECRGEGSSTYYDHCDFYIDDVRQLYVGANVSGWNHYSYEIPAGEHTFTWSYTKDGSQHPDGDYFAVDNIMSNIVWRTPSTGSSTEYFYYNLDEGTYYVVIAQGVCGNDYSPVSEISFTTPLYTYTKSITGYGENTTGGYYLIASPITKVTPTANNGFLTNEYDLYSFDQTFYALEWRNFKSDAFDLVSGQGYLYANSQDVNLTFTGRIYRGNGEISLTRDENTAHPDMQGFNLVGNPYNTRATVNKDFYKMNDTRDGFIAVNHDNAIIEVMDGIFVYAAEDGETITFHEYVPSYAPQPSAGLTMNVTGNQRGNTIDRAIVRFGQSSMMPKFQLNENSTKVYIPMDGKDYAVVSTGNVGELPVNFKAESNGTYTLSFTAQEVSFSYLHLIDNLTGADVNLLNTPSYTFDARTTDYASRFRLVFSTGSSAEGDNFSFVNASGNLCIFGIEGEATLQVVDVLGHVISSNQFSGSYEQKLNVAPGVYMLRLINGNNVKVQKMVIK